MKKLLLLIGCILLVSNLYAADTEISDLTADATPGTDSLIATIDDPSGTPVSRKSTIGQVLSAANDLDSSGDVSDDSHNHVITNIDAFTEAQLETQMSGTDVVTVTASDITSANLATSLSDEEGTGNVVFSTNPTITNPTFTTPTLGAASSTSLTITNDLEVADCGTGVSVHRHKRSPTA